MVTSVSCVTDTVKLKIAKRIVSRPRGPSTLRAIPRSRGSYRVRDPLHRPASWKPVGQAFIYRP